MTTDRLEYLRSQIRAECISMGELAELQSLADSIDPGDVELLEWAGVPEFSEFDDDVVCQYCGTPVRRDDEGAWRDIDNRARCRGPKGWHEVAGEG